MLTAVVIVLLVLVAVAYAAAPLLSRRALDPLPDDRDPVLVDLEEERDALLRAIRELDGRPDLAAHRRDELRARYEAKAAAVLKALERARAGAAIASPERTAPAGAKRRLPFGALALLTIAAVTATALGSFVLPRVGQGTVTVFFPEERAAAEALRDLVSAADRDPSAPNLMALGDAYWRVGDAAGAEAAYRRVVAIATDDSTSIGAPPLAYKRLALLALEDDLPAALELLREARRVDPTDAETLFGIGELSLALGELDASAEAFGAYLATPEGAGDPEAEARLALVVAIGPASEALAERRDRDNLLALADVYWTAGASDPAAELYFEVLSAHDPLDVTALSRVGQFLFVRGRNDDAIALLERAAAAAGGLERLEPQASLFLGNAYAMAGDDRGAVRAWEAHLAVVGADAAGRVGTLLAAARERLEEAGVAVAPPADGPLAAPDTEEPTALPDAEEPAAAPDTEEPTAAPDTEEPAAAPDTEEPASPAAPADTGAEAALAALGDPALLLRVGADLYLAHCASCHGALGEGGVGTRLAGNARAAHEDNVRNVIRFGRGIMPGFGALLSPAEIEVLVRWVGQELATPR